MKKIINILKNELPKLIILAGIPSTHKEEMINQLKLLNYNIIDLQYYFDKIYQHIFLKKDYNVINQINKLINDNKLIVLNSLFISKEDRRNIFKLIDNNVEKCCIYIDDEYENLVDYHSKNNLFPEYLLDFLYKNQVLPINENFDSSYIVSCDLKNRTINYNLILNQILENNVKDVINNLLKSNNLKEIFPYFYNSYHRKYNLNKCYSEYSFNMVELFKNKFKNILNEEKLIKFIIAILNLEIGKQFCDKNVGIIAENYELFHQNERVIIKKENQIGKIVEKIEKSNFYQSLVPHYVVKKVENKYYSYEKISALKARRNLLEIGFSEDIVNEIYLLISNQNIINNVIESNRTMRRKIREVGKDLLLDILKIKLVKELANNNTKFNEFYFKIEKQILEL